MQKLARYWATEYDWRKVEARLKALPQFITEIDGLDIHFIHVRSKHENALPVIVTHGWPGSVIEQLKIIDPLVNPTAHGGKASDAFHVVIPSMPGYGFSGQADHDRLGPGPHRTCLGGADEAPWVHAICGARRGLGRDYQRLDGHAGTSGIDRYPLEPAQRDSTRNRQGGRGRQPAAVRSLGRRKARVRDAGALHTRTFQYSFFMGSRPQTLYGIADSPVGVAAWLLDHDPRSLRLIARAFDGEPTGLTRDDVLDNATLFWLTNTTISAARLYWEGLAKTNLGPKNVTIPVAVSVFPDEVIPAPRSWAERAYPNLIHYNQLDKGGHFAAWEQPKLLVEEMRAGFKSLRK